MLSTTTCSDTIGKSRKAGKKSLQIFFFFFLTTQICFAQWNQQNSGTTVNLNALQFMDANNRWAVGDVGTIIRTTNGGIDWFSQESNTANSLRGVSFVDVYKGWIVGEQGRILKTTDGGSTWVTQTLSSSITLHGVCFVDSYNGWIVGYENAVGPGGVIANTTNGGTEWIFQSPGIPNSLNSIHLIDINNGYAVGSEGIILKTTNGGTEWIAQTSGTYSVLNDVQFVDENIGWAVGEGIILKTADGGTNWLIKNNPGFTYNSVYFTDLNNGWVVGKGHIITLGDIFGFIEKTTDGGTTWTYLSTQDERSLRSVHFTDALNGWVVGDGGIIFHTTNGGNPVPVELMSFTAAANGKEITLSWSTATELNNQGFEVQRKFGSNDFVTIGSVKGHGTTTSPNNYTYVDKLIDAGKYLYRLKQIDYGGNYEYSQTVDVNWSPFTTYKLEQNYPNPFNPTTTIGFGIEASPNPSSIRSPSDKGWAFVTLKVYDVLGNEVRTLVNKEMEAGYHSIDFNASELPSGVYFYQLRVGNFIDTKKLLLLR